MIAGSSRLAHTDPIFHDLKIMKLKELYVYSVQLFMYKYHHDALPMIFSNFYVRNSIIHEHNTRQLDWLHTPLIRLQQTSKTIRVTGVLIYDYFITYLNFNCSYVTFKRYLKMHISHNGVPNLS